ncbi:MULTISPECIES: FAD:protein FMN transferase [unclassified Brucella]|uniref:FAD:protein FMN transferase n=1 Tax=unclassified Brucella TaxID=2632610 RepID=UPI0012AE10DB|nr:MULTISPECIES: FAD:protein FMN transferase [unclassified Brucella]MRN44044.1 FAD:protein FMN transferase [Brucella sp. 09RB8913]MRN59561.1 FAD:protein FMN transferase [Brucella sp. 09RB8918]
MSITRRRVLVGGAVAATFSILPRFAFAQGEQQPAIWQGQALGAPAKIILYHPDRKVAERLVGESAREAERLENIFSLYRPDSEIARLNHTGALASPAPEMVELLGICRTCWQLSDGLFDPTVQPLWQCLRKHFSQANPAPEGPSRAEWDAALAKIGFDHVLFNAERIAFTKPGMALTLNGIAQGYVTDRVVGLLRDAGVSEALVDMGEYRAIGGQPDGKPWRIGIADLEAGAAPEEFIDIMDQALATSSFAGFQFEESGRFNHLLNPKTGYSAALYRRVTVVAPDTAMADALATAFSLMEPAQIKETLKKLPGIFAYTVSRDGEKRRFGA